ncbi:MAG TPA: ferritin-like domain-containing protein [Actinomycetes bacterium]
MPIPAEGQNPTAAPATRIVPLYPGATTTTTRPLLPVDSREQLVYLLTQASELEQGILCEYLFALYSLKRDPQDGLSGEQLDQVTRWGRTLSEIAVQEMLHLTLATNMLIAVGAPPHFHRPNFPIHCQWYPPDVQIALVPFGEAALRHFLYLERPDNVDVADTEAYAAVCECRPLTATPSTLMAAPQEYSTVGHLYRSIDYGFTRLVERYGVADVFIGPPDAQATSKVLGWPELRAVTDLASAKAAIATIVEQGEGADGDWREAHFGRLSTILDEYLAAAQADPTFSPAWPARPAYVRRPPDQPQATVISDPLTAQVADLFDAAHQTLLQALCRLFVRDDETDEEVATLADSAIELMAGVLRPLGSMLTTLPLGPDHPWELAGPAFFMVHPSQFLLPYRRAAWKVMIQRLATMADACVRLGGEPGLGRVTDLEQAVRGIAARLQAHLDERTANG